MRKKKFTRYVGPQPAAPSEVRRRLVWFEHVINNLEQIKQIPQRTLEMFGQEGYTLVYPDQILWNAKHGSKHARTFIRSFERSYITHSISG